MLGLGGKLGKTFWRVLGWTIVWAVFATFFCNFLGLILAIVINRKETQCKAFWRTCFVISIAVPQFVSFLVMRQMLQQHGAVNNLLLEWGLLRIRFHSGPTLMWARVSVILINCWVGIPYTMLQVTGVLQNVPSEFYEAAKIDGANAAQIFCKITLPYIMFIMGPYIITQFTGNINNFNVIYSVICRKAYTSRRDRRKDRLAGNMAVQVNRRLSVLQYRCRDWYLNIRCSFYRGACHIQKYESIQG